MVREVIKILHVLLVVKMGHLRRDCRQQISRNNVSSRNNRNRRTQPSGDVEKADIGQMNVDQQEIDKVTRYHQETQWGPLAGPHGECGPVISSYCGKHVLSGKLEGPIPAVKSNNGLNDEINVENELRTLVGQRKCIFWQTSINEQRQKLRVCINGIFIEGLLDMGAM